MIEMWPIKHRPRSVKEYIFGSDSQKQKILHFIENKSFPHLLLTGKPGSGKTSLVYLFKELFNVDDTDFLAHDASKDNSVDSIRHKITDFISTMPNGEFKIVLLNEADFLSPSAFSVLRGLLEDETFCENARFIFTCNYIHKIPVEIKSRCTEINFQTLEREEILIRSVKILKKEKVQFELEVLEDFVDQSKNDFRKLLNNLQIGSIGGILTLENTENSNDEIFAKILLHLENKDWKNARTLMAENLNDSDYSDLFKFFYDNISELDTFTDDDTKLKTAIIVLADYMYRHETVADKELNFTACIIKLSEI